MDNPERLVSLVDEFVKGDTELPCVEFKVNNSDPERIGTLISAISNSARLPATANRGSVISKKLRRPPHGGRRLRGAVSKLMEPRS